MARSKWTYDIDYESALEVYGHDGTRDGERFAAPEVRVQFTHRGSVDVTATFDNPDDIDAMIRALEYAKSTAFT